MRAFIFLIAASLASASHAGWGTATQATTGTYGNGCVGLNVQTMYVPSWTTVQQQRTVMVPKTVMIPQTVMEPQTIVENVQVPTCVPVQTQSVQTMQTCDCTTTQQTYSMPVADCQQTYQQTQTLSLPIGRDPGRADPLASRLRNLGELVRLGRERRRENRHERDNDIDLRGELVRALIGRVRERYQEPPALGLPIQPEPAPLPLPLPLPQPAPDPAPNPAPQPDPMLGINQTGGYGTI